MFRLADLLEKHNEDIAALESWDNRKPYARAAGIEVPMVARLFRYYGCWADKIHGLTVPADRPYHVQTLHEPIGVGGQIIPWNLPIIMFAWKVGPALASGKCIMLKTVEQTPLSTLYVAKLFHELGYFRPNHMGSQWMGWTMDEILPVKPDEGPRQVSQARGIVVFGASTWVATYNGPIMSTDVSVTRKIVRLVSVRGGGLPTVQAMSCSW